MKYEILIWIEWKEQFFIIQTCWNILILSRKKILDNNYCFIIETISLEK